MLVPPRSSSQPSTTKPRRLRTKDESTRRTGASSLGSSRKPAIDPSVRSDMPSAGGAPAARDILPDAALEPSVRSEILSAGGAPAAGHILAGDVHVAATTNAKSCGGAVAQKLRLYEVTGIIAIGSASVYQAVKSIIMARKYLERDDTEVSVSVELSPAVGPDAVVFNMKKATPYPDTPVPQNAQLRIGRSTVASSLAGGIANRVLVGGANRLSVTCCGAGAVLLLIKALALATKFVAADGVILEGYFDFVDFEERTYVELQLFRKTEPPKL